MNTRQRSLFAYLAARPYPLALLLLLCMQAALQGQNLAISGTVVDGQSLAVSAARVFLTRDQSSFAKTTLTDPSGHFIFSGVTTGQYKLRISASGFQEFTKAIDTERDQLDLSIALKLRPVQSTVTVPGTAPRIVVADSTTGSLTPTRLMDLPQSVQIVSRDMLDTQKVFDFADALQYLPGVQRALTQIEGWLGDEVAMRGFNLNYNANYLRDGFKFEGLTTSDTADIEQVEVMKGPASALYGTGEAGGVVNVITKKPTETPFVSLAFTGGNYKRLRPEFDVSGPLNKKKTLFYRLNGAYDHADSFRKYIYSDKEFIAPYFLWRPNASTSLAFLGEVSNVDRIADYGLVILGNRPAPVPISTNYYEPWNGEADRDRNAGYRFTHTFKGNWTLNNGFQAARRSVIFDPGVGLGDVEGTQVTRLSSFDRFPALFRYLQTSLAGSVRTGTVTHHVAVGFEAGWPTFSAVIVGGFAPSVSVLNPIIGTDFSQAAGVAALQNPFFTVNTHTIARNQSGYAQDQIDLGRHWKALVGIRVERYYQDLINLGRNTQQKQTDTPASPRAGLVYQPKNSVSLYTSYVRSFIPTSPTALSFTGQQFSPEHDEQWETGVKLAPGAGRMSVTAALFYIKKNNVLSTDPNNSLFYVQTGQERSKGAEFEFRGSPHQGWNVLTSYAFTQAQVTQSTLYAAGNVLPNAARHSGAFWTTYQPTTGPLQPLRLSAGVIAVGVRQFDFYNSALLPGYARLDVGAYYDIKAREKQSIRLSLNIQNALDRTYYIASNGGSGFGNVIPGSPISALAGIRWTLH